MIDLILSHVPFFAAAADSKNDLAGIDEKKWSLRRVNNTWLPGTFFVFVFSSLTNRLVDYLIKS